MSTIKRLGFIPSRIIKHPNYSLASVLVLLILTGSSLAGSQMPFAQAQTLEDEENQEAQEPAATVNRTQTVSQGNETITDNGNSGQDDADGPLTTLSTLSITRTSPT